MDNAGDWLYIVFLVIAGISGLFSSKNKKKRPKQVLGQPEREIISQDEEAPQKGFWDILQEMQEPRPQQKTVIKPKKQKKQQAVQPTPFLTAENEIARQIADENRIGIPPMEEEAQQMDIEFNNAAELRKAIIYTEILNRKY